MNISKEHLKLNNLLIEIGNILNKTNKVYTKDILYNSLQPCFSTIKKNKFKEAIFYFTMSENMQHWIMIDLLKRFKITKEIISGFRNNIQDEINNQVSLSDRNKDYLCIKISKRIHKYFKNIYN